MKNTRTRGRVRNASLAHFSTNWGWNHRQDCEWFMVTVHVASAKGDQCLSSPALSDYRGASSLIPALHDSHDGERLRRKGLA